ncbi:MAG: hypothetical protein PHI37_00685 [Candidatus Gracilibacteria bacterium]|nr:hypothetical protein [Candidatus Gracilibacteria bacterium]
MKKLIIFFVISLFLYNTSIAYEFTQRELNQISNFKSQAKKVYDKNPNKAYQTKAKLEKLLVSYPKDTKNYAILNYLYTYTKDYVISYEINYLEQKRKQEEAEKQKKQEEVQTLKTIGELQKSYLNSFSKLSKTTTTISSFSMEPRYDHIYFKNVYFENTGSIGDLTGVFEEIYLVDKDNYILSTGYVIGNYIYFDINKNYLLEKDKNYDFYVKIILNDLKSKTGEIKLKISTPINAQIGALYGIRAISYSNGKYASSEVNITSSTSTLVTQASPLYGKVTDFTPTYNNALEFRVTNDSKNKLTLKDFEFKINGSFLNSLDKTSQFILKRKGTNREFGRANLSSMIDNTLIITYVGDEYDFISPNSFSEYTLEINHASNVSGTREVRLNNIVIGDEKNGYITNLNNYSNTGLPGDISVYRY